MALIGYARVSTTEQDTTLQTDALLKVGTHRILMIRRQLASGNEFSPIWGLAHAKPVAAVVAA